MSLLRLHLRDLKNYIKFLRMKDKWEKNNKNNFTKAGNIFPLECVTVGNHTYGILNIHYYKQPDESLTIGNYCSIGNNCQFILGGGHSYTHLSTYPFKNKITKNLIAEATTKGSIVVEDDVWIGYGCIILSGVTIGRGAVIGAGSIVSKSVPPYSIYVNGRIIRYRFSESIIQKLLKVNYTKLSFSQAEKNLDLLYKSINEENVDNIISTVWSNDEK